MHQRWRAAWVLSLTPIAVLAVQGQSTGVKPEKLTYERDIRPIISARCASCHTGSAAKGNLDLSDYKAAARVVKPGDPKSSVLLQRLKGEGGLDQMPLGFKALEDPQIKLVEDWIRQGAIQGSKETHWAYKEVVKPDVPKIKSAWIKNPIDAFVLDRLNKEGLKPSAKAPNETLLRRASLDVIGLPPTLEEQDRYAGGGESFDRVLDRLLASPRFGEKMAVSWLDLARYADTNGYEKDTMRTAWKYRDWVIDSFNRNQPYDQFTMEQIAGDLMPHPTMDQLIATGFNRNTMLNLEGGVDQEEAAFEVRNDRLVTTSEVWLGQTMNCARCHDHKYDPFTQKDYYRLYAFFANNAIEPQGDASVGELKYIEPSIPAPTATQKAKLDLLDSEVTQLKYLIQAKKTQVETEERAWEQAGASWTRVVPSQVGSGLAIKGTEIWAEGAGPETVTYHIKLDLPPGTTALKVEALPDPARPNQGAGRASSGNFILSKATLSGAKIVRSNADFVQEGYSAEGVLDSDTETGWAIAGGYGVRHELALVLDRPIGGTVQLDLECGSKRWTYHTLGHFALSTTTASGANRFVVPKRIQDLVAKPNRSASENQMIGNWFEDIASVTADEKVQLAAAESKRNALLQSIPTAMVMREGKGKTEAPVRYRGEYLSPREVVSSGTPEALGHLTTGNRLDLAKWIVDKRNPLTARVQVNRLWEMLFGRGLVETSENFGTQGSRPSHPELLDWLASTYMESGWDTKKLLKLIMSSSTYQQSSVANSQLLRKDPLNVLLARGPRFRLSAETIRDSALATGGLLSFKTGGSPVFPFQPEGIWASPYSGERWVQSKGEDAHRRSVYTFWKRTAPYPDFVAFDAASREQCTVRRIRTNSPLQALATLNDPGLFEAAKALGLRYKAAHGTQEQKIGLAFRAVTSRHASPAELSTLETLFNKTKAKKDEDSAWTMLGNVLLNLDEAITKE